MNSLICKIFNLNSFKRKKSEEKKTNCPPIKKLGTKCGIVLKYMKTTKKTNIRARLEKDPPI